VDWPGARPTVEHDRHPDVVIPFDQTWANHEQARAWAREVLEGVPTVAVDGVDHADAHARIEFLRQLADGPSTAFRTGLGCGLQEHLQERAVGERERPQPGQM